MKYPSPIPLLVVVILFAIPHIVVVKAATVPRTLNLMTYNMQLFPAPLTWFLYLPPGPRIKHMPTQIANKVAEFNLDILAFQEAFSSSSRAMLEKTAAQLDFFITDSTPKSWTTPVNAGICVMSRTPLSKTFFQAFTTSCGTDRLSNKGFIYVSTTIVDGDRKHKVGIIATHLQADDSMCGRFSGRSVAATAQSVRDQQLGEINRYVKNNLKDERLDSLILMGDLNMDGLEQSEKKTFAWDKVKDKFAIVEAGRPLFKSENQPDATDVLDDYSVHYGTNNYLRRLHPDLKATTTPDLDFDSHLDYVVPLMLPGASSSSTAAAPDLPAITFHVEHVRYENNGEQLDMSDHHAGIATMPLTPADLTTPRKPNFDI